MPNYNQIQTQPTMPIQQNVVNQSNSQNKSSQPLLQKKRSQSYDKLPKKYEDAFD
jgi:hypothetical protein